MAGRYSGRLAAVFATCTLLVTGCGGEEQPLRVAAAKPVVTVTASDGARSGPPSQVKVYVTGAVAHPGVYALSFDSRIEDAISAAGGFVEGADMPRINLAARVRDEQEIFVPRVGEQIPNNAGGSQLNINAATATEMRDALGISSSLATKIVNYRTRHGAFATVEDLRKVPVPDVQYQRIKDVVTTQ